MAQTLISSTLSGKAVYSDSAIVTAQAWVEEIKAGRSVSDIMQAHNIPEGMIWKRIRLAFLSPKILQEIGRASCRERV